jgi:hypothetical protein
MIKVEQAPESSKLTSYDIVSRNQFDMTSPHIKSVKQPHHQT